MDHHADMDLRPDPETAPHQVMGALFTKLHRALAEQASGRIGVSFPGADNTFSSLGTRLRLHGSLIDLQMLLGGNWLDSLLDHVTLQPPAPVPTETQHRVVRRIQTKSSPARLRRRLMRRHGLDEAAALVRLPNVAAEFTRLPFVQLRSASTGQTFRLFIEHGPVLDEPTIGGFSAYGLSHVATVPWF